MKLRYCYLLLVLLIIAPSIGAQSLTELAKKEKERRNKNKQEGKEVQVITEENLPSRGSTFSTTVDTSSSSAARRSPSQAAGNEGESEYIAEREGVEPDVPKEIPTSASPQEKIAVFERMLTAHRAELKKIDDQITKNNARLAEIRQELNVIGAGVNMPPPAPRADFTPRNPGDKFTLEAEQGELQQKNEQLEAEKRTKADALRTKGRRAGIPASYLNF